MKVVLVQLPVQGHDFFFSKENIPLAAAYLQVIGKELGMDVALLPRPLMSYGSDQAILRFILHIQPDMVGMSCYEWNVERSLFLAQQLKHHLPACTIVLGGPEITPDNEFLLQHRDFDIGVVGEGEEAWELLLQSFPKIPDAHGLLMKKEGRWHFNGNRSTPSALGRWPSPYLSGELDSHLNGVLWLETVRGCVHRCTYCYYHKQFPRIRTFPMERIAMEVKRAWEKGFKEVVFLDPCFARRPDLEKLLDELANINYDRQLQFHAEGNAEEIDPPLAEKMGRTGFVQMEVGLQSINKNTLRKIHRSFHPQRFLQGVRSLQDCGVEVMVDIIAGLPGDTLSDICGSLDWVIKHEAYDFLMLYPLSVLPATELFQLARKLGLHFLPRPPYYLTKGPGLTATDIYQAFHYYAESMEEDASPLEIPPTLDPLFKASSLPEGFSYGINWHHPDRIRNFSQIEDPMACALTISFSQEVLRQPERWSPALKEYLDHNPFALLSIEVPPDVFPEEIHPLWELAQKHTHLIDRDYTVAHTPYRSFLLFSRDQGMVWKWPDPRESHPLILPDGQQVPCHPVCLVVGSEKIIPQWFIDHMIQRYSHLPEIRLWERPED